jgi:hypothetical protein
MGELVTRSVGLLVLLLVLVSPRVAASCTCVASAEEVAWPTLEQAAAASYAVLIGRITKQVVLAEPAPYEGHNVGYVEVEVIDGIKQVAKGATIRVWDAGFGSSCSVDLRPLSPGVMVALALERNGTKYREYQELMKLKVAPGDYLLKACGDYKRRLEADEDTAAVRGLLLQAVRRGRRTRSQS